MIITERSGDTAVPGISVFAVDPGETSGWAWACLGWSELRQHGVIGALTRARRDKGGYQLADSRFMCGEINVEYSLGEWFDVEATHAGHLSAMMEVCGAMGARRSDGRVPGVTHCVVEDFVLRERTMDRSLLSPVRLTSGLFRDVSLMPDRIVCSVQQASDAKTTVTDERLKAWGFWIVGQQHARDAVRHLILALRRMM